MLSARALERGSLRNSQRLGPLTEAGLDTVLMETRLVKGVLRAMPIKTDRRDAEGIVRLLHLGWFRPVQCKSASAQDFGAVFWARKAIQQNMFALEISLTRFLIRRNLPWQV